MTATQLIDLGSTPISLLPTSLKEPQKSSRSSGATAVSSFLVDSGFFFFSTWPKMTDLSLQAERVACGQATALSDVPPRELHSVLKPFLLHQLILSRVNWSLRKS